MQVAGFSVPTFSSAASPSVASPRFCGGGPVPEEPQHKKNTPVPPPSLRLQQFIERLKRLFHTIGKAIRQFLGKEPPKSPFKQHFKQEAKQLHAQLNNDGVNDSLKRLGERLPGAEILQTQQGREHAMHQLPIIALQQLNQTLANDQHRDAFIAATLLNATHEAHAAAASEGHQGHPDGGKPATAETGRAPGGEGPDGKKENNPEMTLNQLNELLANFFQRPDAAESDNEKPESKTITAAPEPR